MSDDQNWLELIQLEVPRPGFPTDVQAASNPLALPAHDCTQQSNSSVMQIRAPVLHPHQLHATNVAGISSVGFAHVPRVLILENDIPGWVAQFDPAMQHSNGPGKRRLETQESLSHIGYSGFNPVRHINNVQTQPLMPNQSFGWSDHDNDLHNDFDPIHYLHGEPSLSGLIQSPQSVVAVSDPTMTISLRGLPPSMPDLDLSGMNASVNFLNTPHNSYTSHVIPQDETCSSVLTGLAALGNPAGIPGISQSAAMETHDDLSMYPIGNIYDTAPSLSTFSDNFDWFNWDPSTLMSRAEDQSVNIDNLPSVAVPSQSLPNGHSQAYGQISTDMTATVPNAIPSNANVAAPYGARPFENIGNILDSQHLHTGSVGYAPTIENGNAVIMYMPSPSPKHTYSHLPGNNSTASLFSNLPSAGKDSVNLSMACVPSLQKQHAVPRQDVSRDRIRPVSRNIRTRPSKSVSKKQRLSAIHQAYMEKGLPEGLNFVMAFTCSEQSSTAGSSRKRRRTDEQRKNKSEVEQRGGSCMMCRYHRKKCSGQVPCNFCVDYWQGRVRASTNFRWTCDVQPRMSGIKTFRLPTRAGIDFSKDNILRTVRRMLEPSYAEFLTSAYKDVFALVDVIESRLVRMIWNEDDTASSIGRLHSYCQSALRWEPVLVRVLPHLREHFGIIEFFYRAMHQFLQEYQDTTVLQKNPSQVLLNTAIFLEDVVHMDQLVFVDAAECEAAKNVLEKHLRFLLARKFDLTKSWRKLNSSDQKELVILNCIQSIVPCIVPRHNIPAEQIYWQGYLQAKDSRYGKNETITTSAQCIGRAPELDEVHHEVHASRNTPSCFCGWIIASLPEGLLGILGLDAYSLSHFFHDTSHLYYSIRRYFAPIATYFRSENTFLASIQATEFHYSVRLTVAKCLRELQSLDAAVPFKNVEFLGHILMESTLLFSGSKMFCDKLCEAVPDNFKRMTKQAGPLATLRMVAGKMYGEKIMGGLW